VPGRKLSVVTWVVATAATIATANASNVLKTSPEGETRRVNSVLLNGAWEFSPGDGGEHAETPEGASRLRWQTVTLPGRFMPWSDAAAANTRFVWARRSFTVSAAQASGLAVLRWNQITFGAVAYINGRKVGENAPTGPYQVMLPAGTLRAGVNSAVLRIASGAGAAKAKSGHLLIPAGFGDTRQPPSVTGDVWIDFADAAYMKWILALPDLAGSKVRIRVTLTGVKPADGLTLSAEVRPRRSDRCAETRPRPSGRRSFVCGGADAWLPAVDV